MTARSARNFRNLKGAANRCDCRDQPEKMARRCLRRLPWQQPIATRGDGDACASRARRAVRISVGVADCGVTIGLDSVLGMLQDSPRRLVSRTTLRGGRDAAVPRFVSARRSHRGIETTGTAAARTGYARHTSTFCTRFASDRLSLSSRRANWSERQVMLLGILLNCLRLERVNIYSSVDKTEREDFKCKKYKQREQIYVGCFSFNDTSIVLSLLFTE